MAQQTIHTDKPATARPPEQRLAYRWGVAMAHYRRPIAVLWLLVIVTCAIAYPKLDGRLEAAEFHADNVESTRASELLAAHYPDLGAEELALVFYSAQRTVDDAQYRAVIERAVEDVGGVAGVRIALGPFQGDQKSQISASRHAALAIIGIDGDIPTRAALSDELQELAGHQSGDEVTVGLAGFSPGLRDLMEIEVADSGRAEAIGLPVAFALLIVALGTVVAAFVPVAVALSGLLLAFGGLFLISHVMGTSSLMLAVATMIGTGIGLDYAMFVASRFREELAKQPPGASPAGIAHACGVAVATAGKTIVASGLIVMISLCSLMVVRAPVFRGIAVGVVVAVIATLSVALTLLPALLALLGPRVNRGALPARWQPLETRAGADAVDPATGRWARWSRTVMARPALFSIAATLVLLLAAAPLAGVRYGVDMGTAALSETASGKAGAIATDNFAPGLLAPITLIATGPDDTALSADAAGQVQTFLTELAHDERIDRVLPFQRDGRIFATVIAETPFDSPEANALVRDIRADAAGLPDSQVLVGGVTAEFADMSDEITRKLPLVVALVLCCSFVFLVAAFRSIVLPVKAIVMNLLATGAALGITVAVFQWGIGESLLGFQSTGFIQVFLPIMVFAMLFGLSMDYEVFLIRRIKEFWEDSPRTAADNEHAVAAGLQHTARPISAAAAIMVVIFGSFLTASVLELKQIGLALAVAVAIDAALVRLILVPALMKLFGTWNWWLPTPVGEGSRNR
ncbi:MMPL family transporter [Nocardia sp. NBC_01009]|uniref:MMPL family transporter n=1 Tax=Nocardia sp. NBC_01009 TaxID=2975996 RepID=UPI00386D1DDF|nr:MMPL family transporter [Nocardia sp. NBC_01009]